MTIRMSLIDLGVVRQDEYFNIYPDYQTAIAGLNSYGGYKIYDGICYIFIQAIATASTTVTFPATTETLNLYYQKNNEIVPFETSISVSEGDYIIINVMYEVST